MNLNLLRRCNENGICKVFGSRSNRYLVPRQRVAQRTAELEAFSYSVSHDLRAPLRHIQGFIEILQHELQPTLSPDHAKHLQIVADSAAKMSELIESLLAFSRLGRVPLRKVPVNLNQLLSSVLSDFHREMTIRRIDWVVEELPEVDGDPGLLHQVFVNLLSNALKYTRTRTKTRIKISHEQTSKEWVLFIQDKGVGFDPQLASRLFGVFQRLHPASEFEGTGIGLANVQRIIQRHGGRVWAEGVVDKGATFYFTLPR